MPKPYPALQALLKFTGPGPEIINGRTAMLAFFVTAATELATGKTLLEQAATPAGALGAAALVAAATAASLAPLLLGRVKPEAAFPSANDSYPDRQVREGEAGSAQLGGSTTLGGAVSGGRRLLEGQCRAEVSSCGCLRWLPCPAF